MAPGNSNFVIGGDMTKQIARATECIEKTISAANNSFSSSLYEEDNTKLYYESNAEYFIEKAFIELLVLYEKLGLVENHKQLLNIFQMAKDHFLKSEMGDCESCLFWSSKLRIYLCGIETAFGLRRNHEDEHIELKNLIRRSIYAICDEKIYQSVPACEQDVHNRIEGILKCYYPDLKTKPAISKAVKNFQPDTGIPSINILIEYKYVTTQEDAKRIVDEILTDTQGYKATEWHKIIFVIYETIRTFSESNWNNLLKDCEPHEAIVLQGYSKNHQVKKTRKKGKIC